MLYFTICPNSASDAIEPTSMIPWNLAVQKSTDYGNHIYTKEQGTIKMFTAITPPEHWRDQIKDASSDAQIRYTYGTEQMLIKNGLFYRPEEYTKEFLEGRFSNDLNSMLASLSDFDEGCIWLALLSIRNALSPYLSQPILSHKDLLRISGKVGAIAHNTEWSMALQCRLVEAAHQIAGNMPGTILNPREFSINKAYVAWCYLFLLPVKELLADKIIPDTIDIIQYLSEICRGLTVHTFDVAYETLFGDGGNTADQVIRSPGRPTDLFSLNKPIIKDQN